MCVDEGVFAARTRSVCNETKTGLATERRKEKRNGASNTIHRMVSPRLRCPCPSRQRIVSSRISSSRQDREAATEGSNSPHGRMCVGLQGGGATLLLLSSPNQNRPTIRRPNKSMMRMSMMMIVNGSVR